MSSKAVNRSSLVRRVYSMLLSAAIVLYLLTFALTFVGGNYLISANLEKQGYHLLPIFEDMSAPLFASAQSNAIDRIALYAAPITDIARVRVYDNDNGHLLAEYRKPGAEATAPLHAAELVSLNRPQSLMARVISSLGMSDSLKLVTPVQIKSVKGGDLLDFGNGPMKESIETVGYVELEMDFGPSRSHLYSGLVFSSAVLLLVLLVSLRVYRQKMRNALQPLLDLEEPLQRIAEGDFDATVGQEVADREIELIRQALQTAIAGLKQRESERNEAVRAKLLADAANEAKGLFLANMSHEIRTPMNGVIGMLELLLDADMPASQREFAKVAHQSAESLLDLINDILDFSKIEAGKLKLECIPFNLLHEMEAVCNAQALAAEKKGLALIVHYPPALPKMMHGDPSRIRQVLTNLLNNAIKFTSQGHIVVDTQASTTGLNQCELLISVTDTGIGLEQGKLDTIFDKFTQADASTTRQYGGTGLGLAICKSLVEMMGGRIGVRSAPGSGATFWFSLVLPLAAEIADEGGVDGLQGVRVLCVDDHPTNLQVLQEQLQQYGMEVDSFSEPHKAIDALREAANDGRQYRIAIVDHQMPGMDGEAFGAAVKSDPALRGTLLVMLSSLSHANDIRREAGGFAAVLSKPVPQQTLVTTLGRLCAGTKAENPVPVALPDNAEPGARPEQDQPFRGKRMLVADDNLVNQQVARKMLERLGCIVDLATNGSQAVALHASNRYDAILMDCQMPELDGYEASMQIRSQESFDERIPIIALTAHAMAGEREKCLAAGMDDFLSKPVRPGTLRDTLERWIGTASSTGPLRQAADAQPDGNDEMVQVQQLFGPAFNELVDVFVAESPARLAGLRQAAADMNPAELQKRAHALAGSCASIGASSLAGLCKALELAARSGIPRDIASALDRIETEYAAAAARLNELALAGAATAG